MCLLDLFRGMGGRWWAVEMDVPVWGGAGFVGRFTEKWGDHRKKNFFIINSVGLSMCDSPIETVKYIWKDI